MYKRQVECFPNDLNTQKRTKLMDIEGLNLFDSYYFRLSGLSKESIKTMLSFELECLKFVEPVVVDVEFELKDGRSVHVGRQMINEHDCVFPLLVSDERGFQESYSLELWQMVASLFSDESINQLASTGNTYNHLLEYLFLNELTDAASGK